MTDTLLTMLRLLRTQPRFSALIVLILSLGLGATAAVFSLIRDVLLTPPPYLEPERLVLVSPQPTAERPDLRRNGWSIAQWEEWRSATESFESIAAYGWTFNFLVLEEGSESLEGMQVTPEYFETTGLEPYLGRTFSDTDREGSEGPVIILGYELWQRVFDGDPSIVGRTVRLSRQTPLTVIGVMPPGVRFMPMPQVAGEPNYDVNAKVAYWLPLGRDPRPEARMYPVWNAVARLRDGATAAEAQAEMTLLTARQASSTPAFAGVTARIEPLTDALNADGRRVLLPLLGAAALVLLISCGNAAALLLVRGLHRRHEYGVRSAIGADRAALFRHVLAESLLLGGLGAVVGAALGSVIVTVLKATAGESIPRADAITVGWPILAAGAVAALLACALAGLLPAVHAAKLDTVEAFRGSGSKTTAGRGQRRLLGGVLVLQLALTFGLLVGAGLLTRSLYNLEAVDSGYDASNVVTMSATAVDGDWQDFHVRALERVAELPGVEGAAFAWGVPLTGNSWPGAFRIEGYAAAGDAEGQVSVAVRAVTSGYFDLLRRPLEEGRDIRPTDRAAFETDADADAANDAPLVAVVNRAFANRYFGDGSALGKRLWTGPDEQYSLEIVGVVSDARTDDLSRAAEPEVYLSLWQNRAYSKHLVVRTSADPEATMTAIRRELLAILPTAGIENLQSFDEIRRGSLAPRTFAMRLLVGFAAVAIVLTLGGVYSVLSLSVAARRREIAIRSAVGAARARIMRLILRDGALLVAAGIAAGIAIAAALSRTLEGLLFGVQPADLATLSAAAVCFASIALLACCVPATRAAQVEPAEALKSE